MASFLSLLLFAIGLLIVINTIRGAGTRQLEFPRHHEPVTSRRRHLSLLLGVVITVCGGGMFVISRIA